MSVSRIGAAMAGGPDRRKREKDDFYPTPECATRAFLTQERDFLYQAEERLQSDGEFRIWEPACGNGAIARVMEEKFAVVATDLRDYGYGMPNLDFLKMKQRLGDAIITNPPFNLAERFILKGRELGVAYQAYLLKSTFFHAACRYGLFQEYPPVRIYPLTWRLDFLGLKAPTMECSWFVWDFNDGLAGARYFPIIKGGESAGRFEFLNEERESA